MFVRIVKIGFAVALAVLLSACEEEERDSNIWEVSTIFEFRQALEESAMNGADDTIVLHRGVYNITSDQLGTFKFFDDEKYHLTIKSAEGLSYDDVILDGNQTGRVLLYENK